MYSGHTLDKDQVATIEVKNIKSQDAVMVNEIDGQSTLFHTKYGPFTDDWRAEVVELLPGEYTLVIYYKQHAVMPMIMPGYTSYETYAKWRAPSPMKITCNVEPGFVYKIIGKRVNDTEWTAWCEKK